MAAYILAIVLMCIASAGYASATSNWLALLGAILFALSDISVARDRFVAHGLVNRLWGLPIYFIAQLLLAWSITGAR